MSILQLIMAQNYLKFWARNKVYLFKLRNPEVYNGTVLERLDKSIVDTRKELGSCDPCPVSTRIERQFVLGWVFCDEKKKESSTKNVFAVLNGTVMWYTANPSETFIPLMPWDEVEIKGSWLQKIVAHRCLISDIRCLDVRLRGLWSIFPINILSVDWKGHVPAPMCRMDFDESIKNSG